MRSRTYAYNGIILGILFGMAAGAYTESIPIGVIVAILGSVICFLIIRFLENLLGRGIDKATDAVANQFAKRGQKSTLQSGNLADRFQSSTPSQPITTQTSAFCTKCGCCSKTRKYFLREVRSRIETGLNTKPIQKDRSNAVLFCYNLVLIQFADIVIKQEISTMKNPQHPQRC